MSTVADFTVPAEAFALGEVLQGVPDVTVELERVVPTRETIVPYFWVYGNVGDVLVDAFESHPDVASMKIVDTIEDGMLVRVAWRPGTDSMLSAFADIDLVLLSARGDGDEWNFEVRARDRSALAAFQSYCAEGDIPLDITRLLTLSELPSGDEKLTDAQREALVAAYDAGYFDSPRTATLSDVAAEIGISRQAVADRLRRGHRTLLKPLAETGRGRAEDHA
jgi:predicted DNA binding protein